MESNFNQTDNRDVLVDENSVDIVDETSRLVTDVLCVNTLYAKVERHWNWTIGINVLLLCIIVILGIWIGLLYIQQQEHVSEIKKMNYGIGMMEKSANESEHLLLEVCKAEFGQTASICELNRF